MLVVGQRQVKPLLLLTNWSHLFFHRGHSLWRFSYLHYNLFLCCSAPCWSWTHWTHEKASGVESEFLSDVDSVTPEHRNKTHCCQRWDESWPLTQPVGELVLCQNVSAQYEILRSWRVQMRVKVVSNDLNVNMSQTQSCSTWLKFTNYFLNNK